jgi:hypothetical protein
MPLVTNFIDDILPYADVKLNNVAMEELPVPVRDLLSLCGGIPSPAVTHFRAEIHSPFHDAFAVRIESDQYEASRNMDFSIGRLDNLFLYVNDPGQGLGTNLFLNQFQAARERGFRKIHLTATAPSEDEPNWTGYYFWACLGFQNREIEEFQVWAHKMKRTETTLSALVQTEEGRDFWKIHGYTWIGDFFLSEGHDCINHLKAHLNRKKIDFPIA